MKAVAIHYKPQIELHFALWELQILLKCAKCHYDGKCKDAAKDSLSYEGGRPGFLRGMLNYRKNVGPKATHTVSFWKLDTMAKILENRGCLNFTEEMRALRMQGELKRGMDKLNNAARVPFNLPPHDD